MSTKENILNKLKDIEFHDLTVNRLSFNTDDEGKSFSVDLCIHNEELQDYEYFTIYFQELIELKASEILLTSKSDLEVYSFDYQWKDEFEGTILFLSGFGQQDFTIEFKCKMVDLRLTDR